MPASRKSRISRFAFRIDIGADVMGDLPGVVAQADPAVERNRTEPNRSAVFPWSRTSQKRDVVPFCLRFCPSGFLESKLLLFPFIIRAGSLAHRGMADQAPRCL